MDTIIVTGFEPFGPHALNPTQDLALQFHGRVIDTMRVIGVVLPCTYYGAFEVLQRVMSHHNPIAVISVGLATSAPRIKIETTAHNIMAGKYPDANNFSPQGDRIIDGANFSLCVHSLSQGVARILHSNNIPADISQNGGDFICNSLMYLTTFYIRIHQLRTKNIFLHTPWTDNFRDEIGELEEGKVLIPKNDLSGSVESIVQHISEV